jgi:hypothetical protein
MGEVNTAPARDVSRLAGMKRHAALGAAVVALAAGAAPGAESTARAEDRYIDVQGPIDVGVGHSGVLGDKAVGIHVGVWWGLRRITPQLSLELLAGLDTLDAFHRLPKNAPPTEFDGLFGLVVGPALFYRVPEGPAFAVAPAISPLWIAGADDLTFRGVAASLRFAVYPFYEELLDVLECKHGWFVTNVLGGLHGWALARQDWVGTATGASLLVGVGVEIGRNIAAPLVEEAVGEGCARHGR